MTGHRRATSQGLGGTVTIISGQAHYNPTTSTVFETLANLALGSHTDTFSYTVTDNHGDTSTATQTATVNVPVTDSGPTRKSDSA